MNERLGQTIVLITAILIGFGLVMVASSSMPVADLHFGSPFYYLGRQFTFLLLGLGMCMVAYGIPIEAYAVAARPILLFSVLMLILLLIPGIGHQVNGSMRWISIGPINLQISEFAKMGFFVYLAWFVSNQQKEQVEPTRLVMGLIPALCVSALILMQPDFGAVVVILSCSLGLLFMAGMPVWQFLIMVTMAATGFAVLAITSPYRFERLTTFMDPWADQFDSGYQLTQALIAFGRGHWFGSGLGSGIQKMLYLPEAHTDFIYAVIAEELGLVGALSVLCLYGILVYQGFRLAREAYTRELFFHANLAYIMSLWLALQSLIAMGVNTGLLPTKGLTLPLLSYGGSSLWVSLFAIMVLLRIHKELR